MTSSLITCPVCCEEYGRERIPFLLKVCGHTFCGGCLSVLRKPSADGFTVRCAICQAPTHLAITEGFPKNFALLEHIESVKAAERKAEPSPAVQTCEVCGKEAAEFGCVECEATFCLGCWHRHHAIEGLGGHPQVPCSRIFDPHCPTHRRKLYSRVCLQPCPTQLICSLCLSSTHCGHGTDTIEKVAPPKREQLQQAVQQAEACSLVGLPVFSEAFDAEEGLRGQQAHAREEIARSFAAMRDALEQREQALVRELEAHVAGKTRRLVARRQAVSAYLTRLYSAIQGATGALAGADDRYLISSFDTFATELQELAASTIFTEGAVVNPHVEMTLPTRDMLAQLHSFGTFAAELGDACATDLHESQRSNVAATGSSSSTSASSSSSAAASSTSTSASSSEVENSADSLRIIDHFDDFGLSDQVLRGVYAYGYDTPSKIQQRALLPLIEGRHVVGHSKSGTGKTTAYCIGIMQRVDPSVDKVQALVLVTSRELAVNTHNLFAALATYTDVRSRSYIVGSGPVAERGLLPHVIVGTPGRVEDVIRRGELKTDGIRMFFIDEADELLSRGYRDQILQIFTHMPASVQVGLFSSTMPQDTTDLKNQLMRRDRVEIAIDTQSGLSLGDGIKQFYIDVEREEWKFETLLDLLEVTKIQQSIVFCNSRAKVERIAERMTEREYLVTAIHDKLSQAERDLRFSEFRRGASRILITTDLFARNVDFSVMAVINFDLPRNVESYLHRVGRSGRFAKALAISFVTKEDRPTLQEIERFYEIRISEMPADVESLLPWA